MALIKLLLQAYADPGFKKKVGEDYRVFLNPESFSHKSENTYDTSRPPGASDDTPRFNYSSQGSVDMSLLLDGTRPIDGKTVNVSKEIATLRGLVFAYAGEIHSPYYVKLVWGSFIFNGRLTTFNVSYTMFRPDGEPLRAKVDLAFISFVNAKAAALKADRQSSDLSHHHLVGAGDTLPLLCHRIYGDARYYLQVARYNQLVHFSQLVPGTLLAFPPLV